MEDPLRPVILGFGRLEGDSLCTICGKNDFTALFSHSERYIPDQSGYECAPRTVAHISKHKDNCRFCILTDCCLATLRLEDIPNSDTFTVSSLAWTTGVSVRTSDEGFDEEKIRALSEKGPSKNSTLDEKYVRIVFRVSDIADENDRYYFIHRDIGGGRTLIEMHERANFSEVTRISLQPWIEASILDSDLWLSDTRRFLSGRPYANQVSFDLVQEWISHLKVAESSTSTPVPIKLIDTENGMLVNADTSHRYVALSYVWGGYKQAELNTHTYSELHAPGSITVNSPNISWTVKDAISVCRQLNERYLWIDCLCIQQDDNALKMAQIERMDEVYGNALFTIVNAGLGERLNSNSPLTGVRPGTRSVKQFSVGTEKFSVMLNTCPRLQDDLDLSKWRSRAWTFQEEHLSRALLIFTGNQCFLQAGHRLFCEDTIFESNQAGIDLFPLTYNTTQSYHCKSDADATGEFDLEDYCFIIESYVKRDISFDEDAVKAVLGMLRRFSVKFDGRESRLIFGHPAAAFDYSLCWTSDAYFSHSRRNCFPSWSWASRKQHVDFDLGHRYNKQHFLTSRGPLATSLYTDALSEGRFTLNKLLIEQIGTDVLPVKKTDIDIHNYYQSHGLAASELAERELHFSTTLVRLRISRFCGLIGEKLDAGRTEHASRWGRFIAFTDHPLTSEDSGTKHREIGEIRLESD